MNGGWFIDALAVLNNQESRSPMDWLQGGKL